MNIVPESSCSITNTTCICTNEELNTEIGACLAQSCTIIEMLGKLEQGLLLGAGVAAEVIPVGQ